LSEHADSRAGRGLGGGRENGGGRRGNSFIGRSFVSECWTVTLPYASPPYRGWTIEEHYTEPLHMRFPTPVNRWIGELSAQGAIGNQGFLQRGNLEPPVEIYFYKRSIMPPAYRHVFFTGGCDYKTACVKIFKSPANFQIFPPDLIFYFIL